MRHPLGWISLIAKDHQFFKAQIGIETPQNSQTSSFCAHATQQDKVFAVYDAAAEPRFRRDELVIREPLVRFYAGYPLRGATGERLGTLSVIDRKPRKLRPGQLLALEVLGRQVVSQFELALSRAF